MHIPIVHNFSLSQADKFNAIPLHRAKAYNAAYGEALAHCPTMFKRHPDRLITMWLAAKCPTGLQAYENSQVRLETNMTNASGVAAWLKEKQLMDKEIVKEAWLSDALGILSSRAFWGTQ